MAERPEDLNLPNAVITRIIKEAKDLENGRKRESLTEDNRSLHESPTEENMKTQEAPMEEPLSEADVKEPSPIRSSSPTFSAPETNDLMIKIPEGVNVSKEARLAISKAASVFVLYATSCSNNFALRSKRKTINAQDVLSAMQDMEFDQFLDPLKFCLDSFRREQQGKKEASEKRKKAAKEETIVIDCDDEDNDNDNDDDDDDDDNDDDDDDNDDNEDEEEDNDADSIDGNVYSKEDEDYVESDE